MSRNTDYVPAKDGELLFWVKNLFTDVELNAMRWGLNPSSWMHINPPLIMTYDVALAKALNPNRGAADVLEKNEARDILKTAVRKYVKEFLEYNSLISDDDRKRMGLPVHDPRPTPVHDPDTIPVVTVKVIAPGALEFHVVDSKSGKKAKPAGIHGFEFRWLVADTAPTDWEQLIHSSFSTRTPLKITFSGNDRGKTLYFALRWENTRGVKGLWTEIISTIIP
jgi:hypothetical protein